MASLIAHSLFALGLWYVIGVASITYRPRTWLRSQRRRICDLLLELLQCPACCGFWIGLGCGLAQWPFRSLMHDAVALAFYTCASNLVLGTLLNLMPEKKS
jgi:hypothetical protein